MKYRIAYTHTSGSAAVVSPAEDARARVPVFTDVPDGPQRLETDEEFIERIAAKDVPQGVPAVIVETSLLPADRYFRNAWKVDFDTRSIGVEMSKARDIHRGAIREQRKPILDKLDVDYTRADEDGNAVLKAQIAQQKRKLRAAPQDPRIDTATTPEELRAVDPINDPL